MEDNSHNTQNLQQQQKESSKKISQGEELDKFPQFPEDQHKEFVIGKNPHEKQNQNDQSLNSIARTFFPKPKKPITQWKKTKTLFWELMGTAIFAYGVCAATESIHIALSLFAGLIIVSPFSGGHLNPAISFAFFMKGDIGPLDFLFRAIGQIIGAIVGAFLSFVILNKVNAPSMTNLQYYWGFPWSDGENSENGMIWGVYNAVFSEALGTFIFSFIVLLMTDKRTSYYKGNNTIIILATVILGLHIGRSMTPRTGGGVNPAFGFSLVFWKSLYMGKASILKPMWIYIAAPFGGAFVAGIYYNWVHFPLAVNHDKTVEKYLKKFKAYQKVVGQQYHTNLKNRPNDLELQDINLKTPLRENQQE